MSGCEYFSEYAAVTSLIIMSETLIRTATFLTELLAKKVFSKDGAHHSRA